jgi:uncharacterized protein (UPF0333 family)
MDELRIPEIIKLCVLNAIKNPSNSTSNRYSNEIMKLAAYVYIQSGKKFYEFFCANFRFPSYKSVLNHLDDFQSKLQEGNIYSQQLLRYLEANNLPKCVAISEDGTKITEIIEYDAKNNILMGFVAPFNQHGMVAFNNYKARSAYEIGSHFERKTPLATNVQVVLAKPIVPGCTQASTFELFLIFKSFVKFIQDIHLLFYHFMAPIT